MGVNRRTYKHIIHCTGVNILQNNVIQRTILKNPIQQKLLGGAVHIEAMDQGSLFYKKDLIKDDILENIGPIHQGSTENKNSVMGWKIIPILTFKGGLI